MGDTYHSTTNAAIFAGGKGIRLRPLTRNLAKPLVIVPRSNKPLIEFGIDALVNSGVTTIVILGRYKIDQLKHYFEQKSFKANIRLIHMREGGTLSAFSALKDIFAHEFFWLMSCDLVFEKPIITKIIKSSRRVGRFDVLIAVSQTMSDEEPVQVNVGNGNITDIGKNIMGKHFATGIYLCKPSIFDELNLATRRGLSHFSQYLGFILSNGYKLVPIEVGIVFDVDNREVLELAAEYVEKNKHEFSIS